MSFYSLHNYYSSNEKFERTIFIAFIYATFLSNIFARNKGGINYNKKYYLYSRLSCMKKIYYFFMNHSQIMSKKLKM